MRRALGNNLSNRWDRMCSEVVVGFGGYMIVAVYTDTNTFDWINYSCMS